MAHGEIVVTEQTRLEQAWSDHPMIAAARDLAPMIDAAADQIEAEHRLPDPLVDGLRSAGVFEMYQPRSIGGPELHPLAALTVCEQLARVDGSVGWCVQVATATTVYLAWVDPEALAEMTAQTDGPLHIAGSARPLGTAVRTDDGYRVKGHWNFASGVRHANWFLATSFVANDDGSRVARSMLVPIGEGEVVGNWDVVGMRGTGSDDFVLDDVAVPRRRTGSRHWISQRTEPLYDPRLMMVATWAPTAGVALGLAQGSIDALLQLGEHTSTGSPTPLRERPIVQDAVAEAEAITSAARAFCIEAIDGAWQSLLNDADDLPVAVARAQLSITHSMHEAVRVADICFHAAGTNAISTANRLERFFRDAHTAVQHAAGQQIHRRVAGRTLLGIDAEGVDPTRDGPNTPRQ